MKTYEYKAYPNTAKETTVLFHASNREEADTIVKQLTKRGSKPEFVAVHTKATLEDMGDYRAPSKSPGRRYSGNPAAAARYVFRYVCPECGYAWTKRGASSHEFQMPCPNEYVDHKLDASQRVTYTSAVAA